MLTGVWTKNNEQWLRNHVKVNQPISLFICFMSACVPSLIFHFFFFLFLYSLLRCLPSFPIISSPQLSSCLSPLLFLCFLSCSSFSFLSPFFSFFSLFGLSSLFHSCLSFSLVSLLFFHFIFSPLLVSSCLSLICFRSTRLSFPFPFLSPLLLSSFLIILACCGRLWLCYHHNIMLLFIFHAYHHDNPASLTFRERFSSTPSLSTIFTHTHFLPKWV